MAIRLYGNGYTGLIHNDDRKVSVKEMRRAIVVELARQGLQVKEIAEMFGLHRQTIRTMARQDPEVTPLFGSGDWTPECQDQPQETCDRCGGDSGCIRRGTRLYCAACHKTGMERMLANKRISADIQEAYDEIEAECETVEEKKSLAKRRKNKRA